MGCKQTTIHSSSGEPLLSQQPSNGKVQRAAAACAIQIECNWRKWAKATCSLHSIQYGICTHYWPVHARVPICGWMDINLILCRERDQVLTSWLCFPVYGHSIHSLSQSVALQSAIMVTSQPRPSTELDV